MHIVKFFWRKNKVDFIFLCFKHLHFIPRLYGADLPFMSTLVILIQISLSPSGIAGFKGKIAKEKKML